MSAAHRQAARDRQRPLRRQGQPAQHRAGLPRSGALRGDRAAGHAGARGAGICRAASRRGWCATTCRSLPPSISCSTTCWRAASTRASASTATASRCRSCCWRFRWKSNGAPELVSLSGKRRHDLLGEQLERAQRLGAASCRRTRPAARSSCNCSPRSLRDEAAHGLGRAGACRCRASSSSSKVGG